MSNELQGKTVAFAVAGEGIEQVELTQPWQAVADAGGTPRLLSVAQGKVQAFNHLDKADTFDVDAIFADASVGDYDALVLPGGVANPDALRTDLENAGAEWVDEEVVTDGALITSRKPDDLPAFSKALVEALAGRP